MTEAMLQDGTLKLTPEQRRRFDEDGFFLVEDVLSESEVETLLVAVDEFDEHYRRERDLEPHDPFQMRNIVAHHECFLRMMDHAAMLPLVVDVMGYNIQLRTSHLDVRPPQQPEADTHSLGAKEGFFPWHSDRPDYGWPAVDGVVPYMEMKIGYYLTDLTQHNSGAICVARGSHRESPWITRNGERMVDPDRVFEVNVRPGTALIWRTALYHCLAPNLSAHTRKCLYYGYQHRWIRPSDFHHQTPELLEGRTPIQLQLLGELGTGKKNYAGDDAGVMPVSRYWRPQDEDIPLKAWAQEQLAQPHRGSQLTPQPS